MDSVFDIPYQELRQWGPGELVDHDKLNQPVDALNLLRRVKVNPPTQVIPSLRPAKVAITSASLTEHRVLWLVSHRGDYLECEDDNRLVPDPDNPGGPNIPETVNVAKIQDLRRSDFDGKTIDGIKYTYSSPSERTVRTEPWVEGGIDETHRITQAYFAGQQIVATRIDLGVVTDHAAVINIKPILWAHFAGNAVWMEVTE